MEIKFFKKIKKKKSFNLRKVAEIDPFFYWKRILVMSLFLLIFVAGASFVVYFLVQKDSFITNESKEKVQALVTVELEEKKLDNIFTRFENRRLNREQIANSKTIIPDPAKPAVIKIETNQTSTTVR